jgi:hypothetical protein
MDHGFHNVGSYIYEEVAAFLAEQGLNTRPHVFMATHSMGGRDWKTAPGKEAPNTLWPRGYNCAYFDESGMNGGWYVFTEEDVTYLQCVSAMSGSSVIAERQEDGTWTVTLEVPLEEDGSPYTGAYWIAFHSETDWQLEPWLQVGYKTE